MPTAQREQTGPRRVLLAGKVRCLVLEAENNVAAGNEQVDGATRLGADTRKLVERQVAVIGRRLAADGRAGEQGLDCLVGAIKALSAGSLTRRGGLAAGLDLGEIDLLDQRRLPGRRQLVELRQGKLDQHGLLSRCQLVKSFLTHRQVGQSRVLAVNIVDEIVRVEGRCCARSGWIQIGIDESRIARAGRTNPDADADGGAGLRQQDVVGIAYRGDAGTPGETVRG